MWGGLRKRIWDMGKNNSKKVYYRQIRYRYCIALTLTQLD